MRTLFATYPVAFHTPGGGEIQLLSYKRYLEKQEVEVTLFNQWEPRFLEHDVVHFFSCLGGSIPFCGFVKKLGLPLVISSSLWLTEATKKHYALDDIRYQLSLADRIVTNSDMENEALSRILGIPRDRFVTIYNGVDDAFLERAAPEHFLKHFSIPQHFVLNVGNIEPRKNQLALVRAVKTLGIPLVLIGHIRDSDYGKQVMEEGNGFVHYLGYLPHDDLRLRAAYAACEVFCLPSTLETPGLAALEAAAAGARMAITQEGSTKEYFADAVDYLNPSDVSSIAKAITTARERKNVNELSQRISHSFRWDKQVLQLKTLYAELTL